MKELSCAYCQFAYHRESDDTNKVYHDTEYGFPILDDNELFGRLILEINQAGLSWTTILNKKDNFRAAYSNFDIATIAAYDEEERARLLSNAGIIRNKLKVNAAIHNANVILGLQQEHGSFKAWLDLQFPKPLQTWVQIFKKHFKFTGGEITNEFLMSSGYIKGAHGEDCPIYDEIMKLKPKWMEEA